MRLLAILAFALISFASPALASILRMETVVQPLYLHGSETDAIIAFEKVPFVTFHADPEWRFPAIAKPCIPQTDGTWKPHDINLASLYRISISARAKEDSQDMVVTVDASKSVKPEGYPFSIEQVIDAVTTCVKLMSPPRPEEDGRLEIVVKRPAAKAPKRPAPDR